MALDFHEVITQQKVLLCHKMLFLKSKDLEQKYSSQ